MAVSHILSGSAALETTVNSEMYPIKLFLLIFRKLLPGNFNVLPNKE